MKTQKIKLSKLEGLKADDIAATLSTVVSCSLASPNGSVEYLQKRVFNFETKYKMSSEEMIDAVASGKLTETEAFATWAMDCSLLKDLSANRG